MKTFYKQLVLTAFGLFAFAVVLVVSIGVFYEPPTPEEVAAEATQKAATETAKQGAEIAAAKAKEAACRQELRCWADKHRMAASSLCLSYVRRAATSEIKWNNEFLENKLKNAKFDGMGSGKLVYTGDKLMAQNTFGVWVRHRVECGYDPSTKEITSFSVKKYGL